MKLDEADRQAVETDERRSNTWKNLLRLNLIILLKREKFVEEYDENS